MGAWDVDAMSIPAGDGRVLEVVLAGPPDGVALFSHHGTPGAAEMLDPLVEVGAQRNLRHITYSRPGYGRSDRLAGRSVASCAADVAAIADALGYDRFYSVGSSGGAPHSIALAAMLPDRVISVAAIASPAPVDAEGLDWTAGMAKDWWPRPGAATTSFRPIADLEEREACLFEVVHNRAQSRVMRVVGHLGNGFAQAVADQHRGLIARDLGEGLAGLRRQLHGSAPIP